VDLADRVRRQLANVDPAYGFSGYFKPVVLANGNGGSGASVLEVVMITLFAALFILLSASAVLYFVMARRR